jgi:ABC-type multidrug transport system fused ATPase/permease subunit
MTTSDRTEPILDDSSPFSRKRLDRLGVFFLSVVFLFILISGTLLPGWPRMAILTQLLACLALVIIFIGEAIRLALRIDKLPYARKAVRVVASTTGVISAALSASLASHWIHSITHASSMSTIHTLAILTSIGTAICWTAILGVLLGFFGISWFLVGAAHGLLLQMWNTALMPVIAFLPALKTQLKAPHTASRTIVQGVATLFAALALIHGAQIAIDSVAQQRKILSHVIVALDFYGDHRCPQVPAAALVSYVSDKVVNIAERSPEGWSFRIGSCRSS